MSLIVAFKIAFKPKLRLNSADSSKTDFESIGNPTFLDEISAQKQDKPSQLKGLDKS